jgi:hypothetical protein
MNFCPPCGHQRDLTKQEHKPGGKQGSVQMKERREGRLSEKVFQIVGSGEAGEHDCGGHDRQTGVEDMVPALAVTAACDIILTSTIVEIDCDGKKLKLFMS